MEGKGVPSVAEDGCPGEPLERSPGSVAPGLLHGHAAAGLVSRPGIENHEDSKHGSDQPRDQQEPR